MSLLHVRLSRVIKIILTYLLKIRQDQWCRSVAKRVRQDRSERAIRLFQITPNVNGFQTFQQSRFLAACTGASKNQFYLPFFDISLLPLMMWNLQSTAVLNERMRHFRGQNIFLPHLHFQGSRPKPPYLRPLSIITVSGVEHISRSAIMETTQTVNTANQSSIMDDASLL